MKADERKDEVMSKITEYADRFVVLPLDSVGVVVTKMDIERKWTETEFTKDCDNILGIEDVVYSSIDKSGDDLLQEILDVCCRNPYDLNIDSEMFLRMFKFQDSNRKILKVTSDLKHRFTLYKEEFDQQIKKFPEKERVDLFFEFKAFMTAEVEAAKKEMSDMLGFDFTGEDKFLQTGHVANMVNQIRTVIYDVRMESLKYQSDHGAGDLRKCPHCGRIWAKVEGCEGQTTCGNVPSTYFDVRNPGFSIMATFTFRITAGRLIISRTGERSIAGKKETPSSGPVASTGCKGNITWSDMQKVSVPEGFGLQQGDVNTEDVFCLPQQQQGNYLSRLLNRKLGYVEPPPANDQTAADRAAAKKTSRKFFKF